MNYTRHTMKCRFSRLYPLITVLMIAFILFVATFG